MAFAQHIHQAHGHSGERGVMVTSAHAHGIANQPAHDGPTIGQHDVQPLTTTTNNTSQHVSPSQSKKPASLPTAIKYVDANTQIANFFKGPPTPAAIKSAIDEGRAAVASIPPPAAINYSSADDQIKRLFPNGFTGAPPKAASSNTQRPNSVNLDQQLDDLEKQFAQLIADAKKVKSGVTDANTRIEQLEKDTGIKPSKGKGKKDKAVKPTATPTATTTAVAKEGLVVVTAPISGGVLTISSAEKDGIMVALKPFVQNLFTASEIKIVETSAGVSSLKTSQGVVEGALAIFAQLTPWLMGADAEEAAVVHQWCIFSMGFDGVNDSAAPVWGTRADNAKFGAGYGDITTPPPTLSDKTVAAFFEVVNTHLATRCFFAGFTLTLADLFMWVSVKKWLDGLSGAIREVVPNLVRWFNHAQHTRGLTNVGGLLGVAKNGVNPKHMQ
eukprot:m.71851 g.71851  ORF g.71851 m.71851 type:complete len:442 (-) comp24402_c0_seq2:394-1719(-)